MKAISKSILQTIIYSDLFDYPLTKTDVWRYLISKKPVKFRTFDKGLNNISEIQCKDRFYFLKGRESIIEKRIRREKESKKKILMAKKIIPFLSIIPTISFIGISGSVAMKNAEKNEDIDLFVITKKGTLWITRLLMIIILSIKGVLRRRCDKIVENKICLNMIIEETCLLMPKDRRNLYTAHEIVQLLPLLNRWKIYEKFLKVNKWVKKVLPNSIAFTDSKFFKKRSSFVVLRLNSVAKNAQIFKINKRKTGETVRADFVAFHPLDMRDEVLFLFKKRLKNYKIYLNSQSFYY